MKQTLILLVVVIATSCTTVQYVTHSKTDVLAESFSGMPSYSTDHSVFWEYIVETNPTYRDYQQDNGKLTKKSRAEFQEKTRFSKLKLGSGEVELPEGFLESFVGTPYTDYISAIVIQGDAYDQAYVTPDGVVRIAANLLEDYPEGSLGIVAHEIAHYVLKHSEVNYIVKKKAERRARNQTNVAGVLAAIGATAGTIGMYEAGVEIRQDEPSLSDVATKIALASKEAFYNTAEKVNLSYSRDQELEADMVACMFMKWIGMDVSAYIHALEDIHLKRNYDYEPSMYDTHPLYKLRIDMMEKYFLSSSLDVNKEDVKDDSDKTDKGPQSEYFKRRVQKYKGL